MEEINDIISKFTSVSLGEIEEVKLMSRIDRKYWFHISKLASLLGGALENYNILEINGQRIMEYQTTYFDTPDNTMYLKHHNRKMNRYKIRQRRYLSTNGNILEIKFKTNKKRTIKQRIATNAERNKFIESELEFINNATPFTGKELEPVLNNQFKRITLIHKDKLDRCTIDLSPVFWNRNGKLSVVNLVIFEVKRGKSLNLSPIVSILKDLKIRQRGMSKYCTGRAMLEKELKKNTFKSRLRFLNKELKTTHSWSY